jgi:hypothetical protein
MSVSIPARPTIVDLQDGPCEMCLFKPKGQCNRCAEGFYKGEQSDSIQNMGGNGFRSVRPSHFHLSPVMGIPGREAFWDELCIDCYRAEYRAIYQEPPPV